MALRPHGETERPGPPPPRCPQQASCWFHPQKWAAVGATEESEAEPGRTADCEQTEQLSRASQLWSGGDHQKKHLLDIWVCMILPRRYTESTLEWCMFDSFLFFNPHLRTFFFSLLLGRRGEREREGERETIGCFPYAPWPGIVRTRDRDATRNLCVCPDRELNLQPFSYGVMLLPTEPRQLRLIWLGFISHLILVWLDHVTWDKLSWLTFHRTVQYVDNRCHVVETPRVYSSCWTCSTLCPLTSNSRVPLHQPCTHHSTRSLWTWLSSRPPKSDL